MTFRLIYPAPSLLTPGELQLLGLADDAPLYLSTRLEPGPTGALRLVVDVYTRRTFGVLYGYAGHIIRER